MQRILASVLFGSLVGTTRAVETNPLAQVIKLLDDLSAKVSAEGEAEGKAYREYTEWCDDVSKETAFEIKSAKSQKAKLEAKIQELTAEIEVSSSKIEDLAATLSSSEAELKNATDIRKGEKDSFNKGESELLEVVDTLGRAIGVLEKEMQTNPAALAQVAQSSGLSELLPILSSVVDAAGFSTSDKQRLVALVQAQQSADEDDSESDVGAPAADAYKSHSSGIFDVLGDLKDKAETQLSELRKAEKEAQHNYSMLKQGLDDQMAADTKEMDEEKASKAAAQEGSASATGDLEMTTTDLKTAEDRLAATQKDCMQVATDHDATVAARETELKVIAEADKVLQETTGGAASKTYSFLQMAVSTSSMARVEFTRNKLVTMVKRLAKTHHSAALNQLASRIGAVLKLSSAGGEDPFSKVKGLITDMISKLQAEASEEATEKAYCDSEMSKTTEKKEELTATVAKLTSKIDIDAARSSELKEQVKDMQQELAAITEEQAEMDKVRKDQHDAYVTATTDLELGLSGVRKALVVLRDYYAKSEDEAALVQDDSMAFMQQPAKPQKFSQAGGAGGSIIGILEVVESDFATDLAKEETAESEAVEAYEKETQENKVLQAEKEQSVKYKTQEFTALDKNVADLSSDRDTTNTELDAVLEYDTKLKERCVAKPETYEKRKERRESEIAGLKEAMVILEGEAAFLQKGKRLRGHHNKRVMA